MIKLEEKSGMGYEIVTYYPKENGRYTAMTGNVQAVYQTNDVAEVAHFLARRAWCSPYEDSNFANPTVFYNGKPWGKEEMKIE